MLWNCSTESCPPIESPENTAVSVSVTMDFTLISRSIFSLICTPFQTVDISEGGLDLLLQNGKTHGEMIMLCNTFFELLDAVIRELRADEDTAKRAAERSQKRNDGYNKLVQYITSYRRFEKHGNSTENR